METLNTSGICELVRSQEEDYIFGTTHLSEHVDKSMYDDLARIDAYLNSKHISGPQDSLKRDKPFFNIVTAAANIWYWATDIDRKDIVAEAIKQRDYLLSFVATAKLHDWMRKERFGQFLNEWGLTLARYGSSVVKFVENSSGLHKMVIPWNRLIVDAIDFDNNPVIEVLELTPAQLRENENYDQEMVEDLIESVTTRKGLRGQQKDQKANYIKVYEVHGKMPKSFLTGNDEDDKEYVQQMQVISFVKNKVRGKFDDYVLFKSKEKRSPYMITHLIKEEGQTLSIGAVQHLFEAQWMVNHSIKAIKDQLDLASKLIFQTADSNYANKSVLSAIETGDILVHKESMPLTHIANNANDITSLQNFGLQWQQLGKEITGTPGVTRGETMPSNTPYRLGAILQNEAHSNFEMMVENKGLYIEEMMQEFILPYLKRQLDTTEEIVATLDEYGIDKIDEAFIPAKAVKQFNKKAVQAVLNRTELPDFQQELQSVQQGMGQDRRFFVPSEVKSKTWKDVFKDFEWKVKVDVSGEQGNKQAVLTTLSSVLQTIATNPAILQDQNAKMLFNKILETSNISPIQFKPSLPQAQPPMVGAGSGGGSKELAIQ